MAHLSPTNIPLTNRHRRVAHFCVVVSPTNQDEPARIRILQSGPKFARSSLRFPRPCHRRDRLRESPSPIVPRPQRPEGKPHVVTGAMPSPDDSTASEHGPPRTRAIRSPERELDGTPSESSGAHLSEYGAHTSQIPRP